MICNVNHLLAWPGFAELLGLLLFPVVPLPPSPDPAVAWFVGPDLAAGFSSTFPFGFSCAKYASWLHGIERC